MKEKVRIDKKRREKGALVQISNFVIFFFGVQGGRGKKVTQPTDRQHGYAHEEVDRPSWAAVVPAAVRWRAPAMQFESQGR